eukprot:749291-Hanusia_phi.AAC.8
MHRLEPWRRRRGSERKGRCEKDRISLSQQANLSAPRPQTLTPSCSTCDEPLQVQTRVMIPQPYLSDRLLEVVELATGSWAEGKKFLRQTSALQSVNLCGSTITPGWRG